MNRSKLQSFVSRCCLGGAIDTVKIIQKDGEFYSWFKSQDRNVVGNVSLTDEPISYGGKEIPENSVIIGNTDTFQKYLGVFDSEISIELLDNEVGQPYKLRMSDGKCDADFLLSAEASLSKTPKGSNLEEFPLSIKLTPDVISKYVKAASATSISDTDVFTIKWIKDGYKLYVGSTSESGSRIRINLEHEGTDDMPLCTFSAKYLKEIFNANKDYTSASMLIANENMAKVEVVVPDFKVAYYLVKTT